MNIMKKLTNKTSEKVKMQQDLKAGASEEETLSDHYVILRTLGKGNFAEVKLAYHLHTEEQVAIKVLPNGTGNDFRIKTEINIFKMLNHPYIIKLFHIINTKEYTYLVMEHAAQGDLVSHIDSMGHLQEEQAQHIFTQLVCAVHYCHENNIAHRDIKLDNILLDDKGAQPHPESPTQAIPDQNICALNADASDEKMLEEQVAIKILQKGTENDFRIKTEIDIFKMLDHPYIIKLFHIINTKEYTYLVLEHAARGDLVSHIERVGYLQEEQAQHIFTQLVCAVHYCHKNNIGHRDIKLDNILLDDKGNIKLCDFGLAGRVTSGQVTKGFYGTLEYCAPELFSGKEYDPKAVDIWSMEWFSMQ
ncbi:sperm motility kinase-like protein [Cricetulus griseus]|nr:sperm motility kinase-like protein [Cricetulus griseus]